MTSSELITTAHLNRRAVIYVRQSSPQQVISHQESLRLQYDLRQRALACGWPETAIDVIDTDLGQTARTTQGRAGFGSAGAWGGRASNSWRGCATRPGWPRSNTG